MCAVLSLLTHQYPVSPAVATAGCASNITRSPLHAHTPFNTDTEVKDIGVSTLLQLKPQQCTQGLSAPMVERGVANVLLTATSGSSSDSGTRSIVWNHSSDFYPSSGSDSGNAAPPPGKFRWAAVVAQLEAEGKIPKKTG